MKTKELQIGDWVKWKDKYVQIATISGIVYSFGHIDVELAHCGSGLIERHDLKSISPIPLTPEILERNGFKYFEECNSYILQTDDLDCVVLTLNGLTVIFHWHDIPIICVHQLQRVLRLCGLNELADNLKLEEVK